MNIPKFFFVFFFYFFFILWGQFAFTNDSKIRSSRLVRPRLIQISLILSILPFFVVTHQSFINQNCPLFFLPHNSNTKTHRKPVHINQFISSLRVTDSHRDYGPQPFRQSFRKVSSNYKALSFSFGFTFFSLLMYSISSVQGHSFSTMLFFFLEFYLMFY